MNSLPVGTLGAICKWRDVILDDFLHCRMFLKEMYDPLQQCRKAQSPLSKKQIYALIAKHVWNHIVVSI